MDKRSEKKFMRLAIREARKNLVKMQGGPFGACIVKDGKVLALAHNTVLKEDASCHAEINAIRKASLRLKSFDLSGCVIYSTTEPCPMCFSAIHWARIGRVVYGTSIADAEKIGFNELAIPNLKLKVLGKSPVKIRQGFLLKECRDVFRAWNKLENRRVY